MKALPLPKLAVIFGSKDAIWRLGLCFGDPFDEIDEALANNNAEQKQCSNQELAQNVSALAYGVAMQLGRTAPQMETAKVNSVSKVMQS